MSIWTEAREVLMFDGFIDPDQASHLASRIDRRCHHFLDTRSFGAAQMVVGNVLIEHRPVTLMSPATWTFRKWLRSLFMTRRRADHTCVCGWYEKGTMHQYHQADMINEAILQNIAETNRRMEQYED